MTEPLDDVALDEVIDCAVVAFRSICTVIGACAVPDTEPAYLEAAGRDLILTRLKSDHRHHHPHGEAP